MRKETYCMKIVQETLDEENFLEILLTKKEIRLMLDFMVIDGKWKIGQKETNVGVRQMLDIENDCSKS